jgi:outer membrane protein assembly factor BamB
VSAAGIATLHSRPLRFLRFDRSRCLCVPFAVFLVGVGVLGCADGEEESKPPASASRVVTDASVAASPATGPPPAPQLAVRVIDGDSSRPVRGARVVAPGATARTERGGVAELTALRKRVRVRVSAPGYSTRTVRLDFRGRPTRTVELWRPALQWPMYGANPARTQAHAGITLRPPFRTVWRRRLNGLVEFPAVVWEGVAYINSGKGWLRALSMADGHLLWKKRVGTFMASSPAIDPQRRLIVTTSMLPGDVKIVDMDTGRVRWRLSTGLTEPSPVIRNGVVYFAATSGNVYALDLDRRRLRWTFRGGVKITGSPALVGRRLFVGDYAGRVFALNAHTGRLIWTGSAGSRVYGTTAVANGRVFVPSVFSGLSALSERTGRLLWRIPAGAYLYSAPAVFRGRVYFATYAGLVYCVDVRSGRILWTRPTGGRVSGAVQVVAGVVYAASMEGRITAWHWRSGRARWSFPHGRYVPVSGNGSRLLMHGGGRIWAVQPKSSNR